MLLKIGSLRKGLRTIFANERLLSSVHSQVVVKVVDLPEELGAAHLVTFKDFHKTFGPWVHILEDAEVPRARFLKSLSHLIDVQMSTWSLASEKTG